MGLDITQPGFNGGTIAGPFFSGGGQYMGFTTSTKWNPIGGDGTLNIGTAAFTGMRTFSLGGTSPATIGAAPAQGQVVSILQAMELLTIAAAASTTTTMLVPAGAVVLSISVRVTTVIPTAATFNVSIGASGNFNTVAVPVAATTTDQGTALGAKYIPTAAGITITPNLTPGAATGVVRITASYYLVTPATS